MRTTYAVMSLEYISSYFVFIFFFFFQAEDGIRDLTVTGVQTCALPISYRVLARVYWPGEDAVGKILMRDKEDDLVVGVVRSEERRVGKEGRSRWSPYH